MDVVGYCTAPGKSSGAADIVGQEALAYSAGTTVAVLAAQQLQVVCTLHGHRAQVTAVKWRPAHHSRDFKEAGQLRLASGDSGGGVVVWDVLTARPIARLEDIPAAREFLKEYANKTSSLDDAAVPGSPTSNTGHSSGGIGVTSLAWVLPDFKMLAVVVSPALLLLWDVTSGSIVWRRELVSSGPEVFSHMCAAPLDSRQLCLCGHSGALLVLQLTDPARDKVQVQQYRVNLPDSITSKTSIPGGGSSSLQALFSSAPGLLVLLLPRELVVFALELGQPAASSPLPSGLPVLSHLLGVYGQGFCQGIGDEGGLDFAYCTHVDGSLSVWVRTPGELRFKLGSMTKLIPSPSKGASAQVTLSAARACLVQQQQQQQHKVAHTVQTAATTAAVTQQLTAALAGMHLTREGAAAGTTAGARKTEGPHSIEPPTSTASALSGSSLLILGVTSDGRQWQWQVPVPQYLKRSFLTSSNTQPVTAINPSIQAARASAVPEAVAPQLTALLHGLSGSVTATAWQPCPVLPANQLSKVKYSASAAVTPIKQATVSDASNEALVAGEAGSSDELADSNSSDDLASSLQRLQTQQKAAPLANCVALAVAATSTGHVEVICCRRGVINPTSVEVCMSHAVHKDVVRSVRWLGSTSRVVSFSSERISNGAWRNSLVLTDVRTGQSIPFRDNIGSEGSPMSGIRVSPSGTYILLLLKGAPCELWTIAPKDSTAPVSLAAAGAAAVASVDAGAAAAADSAVHDLGGEVKPWRVRLLDLPFSAVEWVAADEGHSKDIVTVWAAPDELVGSEADESLACGTAGGQVVETSVLQSPPERRSTGSTHHTRSFGRVLSALTSPSMSAAGDGMVESSMPKEMLAFGLKDGRSGVLSVRGRKVTDMRPKRPLSSPAPGDSMASALAAAWPLLVLGDADGTLLAWDLTTGRCNALATGNGVIRRIQLAPACSPLVSGAVDTLVSSTPAPGSERLRLAVLFTGGHFGVYELDAAGRVRQTAANPAACARVGKALDISWVCMPRPVGAGAILSVVLEDGSICLLDVAQSPIARPNPRQRRLLLQQLLGTPSPAYCNWALPGSCCSSAVCVGRADVILMPPRPLGSSVLLPQPYVMLLRYILQAGIRQDILLYLSSSCTEDDEDIRHELLMTLPRAARATLSHITAQAQQQHQLGPGQQQQQQIPGMSKAKSSALLLLGSTSSGVLESSMQRSSSKLLAGMQDLYDTPADEATVARLGGVSGSQPFDGDLVKLLRMIASVRGCGQLLSTEEWRGYSEALKSGLLARRMAVAADVSGHHDEARFWTALPTTLATVKALQTAILQHQESAALTPKGGEATTAAAGSETAAIITADVECGTTGDDSDVDVVSDYDRLVQQAVEGKSGAAVLPSSTALASVSTSTAASAGSSPMSPAITRRGSVGAVPGRVRCSTGPEQLMSEGLGAIKIAAAGRAVRLWDEELVLSAAQETLLWHEALPGQVFESEGMLERRLLEYVVLGDYATAVAFLLSTPPESSVSYYRSVVCALALAASASLHAQSTGSNTSMQASATLHLQAAKVVSAHAASIGDNLLGVPLNCSAGLSADAVTVLQEAGRWQSAAVLIARALTGTERAQALSRWSSHVLHQEGSVWHCVGLLTAAGCLSAALQVLRGAELPDCAHAYVQACQEAGLLVKAAFRVQPQMPQQQAQQQQQDPLDQPSMQLGARFSSDAGDKAADELFQDQGSNAAGMELFDLLGQRTRMLGVKSRSDRSLQQHNGAAAFGADNEPSSGSDEIRTVTAEYASYLCTLLSTL